MPKPREAAEPRRSSDAALWHEAMRGVARLRASTAPVAAEPALPAPAAAGLPPPARSSALPPLDRFAGIDRASAERLKRGRYAIDARLDLHGMTQAEAHRALRAFVEGSRAAGWRCVLVITGHGRLGGGILKAAVPRWLDEPGLRASLLAIAPAQPRDGAGGALYLLLRRPRPPAAR